MRSGWRNNAKRRKNMRIPGIKSIGCIAASSVPAEFELQAMAGISPSIVGYTFQALTVIGDATLELSDSNEHNGSNQKATLTFVTESKIEGKRVAFIVVTSSGAKYLIGTSASVPAVSIKDTWTAPSSANNRQVSVELNGPVAWIRVEGVEATVAAGDYITFQDWRQIADATYSQLGHTHTAPEVTDNDYDGGMTQDEINQDLADLAAAGIVL